MCREATYINVPTAHHNFALCTFHFALKKARFHEPLIFNYFFVFFFVLKHILQKMLPHLKQELS